MALLASVATSALEARRRRSEADAERRRLGEIVERLPLPVAVLDAGMRYTEVNAAFRDLHPNMHAGISYHAMQQTIEARHLNDRPIGGEDLIIPRVFRGEEVPTSELRVRTRQGWRILLSRVVALHDARGAVSGAVLAAQDVTAMRELADTKDRFIHIASHELRSPLAAMQACTSLL